MRRWTTVVTAVACLALLTVGASAQQLAADEGVWQGQVSFRGESGDFDGRFAGTFSLNVLADESVEGSFGWTNTSGGTSTAIGGVIVGTSSEIRFEITDVVSNGVSIDGASGGGDVELTFVSCERIEGRAAQLDTSARVSEVIWFAVRDSVASLSPGVLAALAELGEQVNDVLVDYRATGVLDFGLLDGALNQAEELGVALERSAACEGDAALFRSLIAADLEPLLELVVGDGLVPGDANVSAFVFQEIVFAALRAGLFGSGAAGTPPGSIYDDLVQVTIDERIDAAAARGDLDALSIYWSMSTMLGYEDLEAKAAAAIVEVASS